MKSRVESVESVPVRIRPAFAVQFWIRHRGYVWAEIEPGSGWNANALAAILIHRALHAFNLKWPGARRNELHVLGITDGKTRIDIKDLAK